MDEGKFKTVTSGGGYRHNHMQRGQDFATWHGIQCPKCKHIFTPRLMPKTVCPSCGFEEKHDDLR